MSIHTTRPGIPVQPATPPDCRHSREPFDAAFRCINERRDISPVAKLTHAHLVTLHRTGRAATQAEIGGAIGCSRHQVWRAVGELVEVGLVQTIRYGLGRPNGYVLLGLDDDDLNGRATGSRPRQQADAGPRNTAGAASFNPKNRAKKSEDYGTKDYTLTRYGALPDPCTRCGSRLHATREHGPTPSR